MNKLVSIAEFAKMCGKPKAEVYKMLAEETNKPFVSVVDGMKMVDIAILDKKPEEEDKKEEGAESLPKSAQKPQQSTDEASTHATITALTARIEELEEELKVKDNTIMELSLKLAEMAQKTQEISEKALNTVAQQQYLTAITAKRLPWYKRFLAIGKAKDERENIYAE
nr:unnamed protein product [uncultured bacterium]